MTYLFQNFAYCALTADVDDTTTTFPVDETGRLPSNGDLGALIFVMTVESTYADNGFETVRVTSKDTTSGPGNLTVQRGYENTAVAHLSGTVVKGAITAGILTDIYNQISSSEFINLFGGDWTQQAYAAGAIVRYRGGLYGTVNPVYSIDLDPLTPSDYSIDGNAFYVGSNGGTTSHLTGEDRAAQGFECDADTTIYGVLLECPPGVLAGHTGETINVGIATSLGGGTPTFVTEKAWVVTDKDAALDSLNVVFDAPVTLTASTQYYVVVIGDSGATGIVGAWLYDTTSNMTIAHGASGSVIGDSMYDAFYDSTFSTNLTGSRFWVFLMNSVTNDWTEILPPPVVIYDTTLPTADANHRGQLALLQQSGIEDILSVCLRNSDGTSYGWFEIVRGDAIVDLSVLSNGVATVTGTMTAGGNPISSHPPSDHKVDAPYLDSTSGSVTFDLSAYTPNAGDSTEDGSPWDDFNSSNTTTRSYKSAWVKYVCTVSGTATFDTIGSGYDTYIRVLDAGGTQIGVDDDSGNSHGGSGGESWLQVSVTAGTTYYIRPHPYPSSPNGSGTSGQQAATKLNWSTPG